MSATVSTTTSGTAVTTTKAEESREVAAEAELRDAERDEAVLAAAVWLGAIMSTCTQGGGVS